MLAGIALRGMLVVAQNPGFISVTDSSSYLVVAHVNFFAYAAAAGSSPWPAGYPAFIWFVYQASSQLSFLMVVQHVVGVATALLWFLTVRQVV
ncbi:MAG TPA: hypothetical protein VI111_04415, partial [Thermoleophilaceae bacterium]